MSQISQNWLIHICVYNCLSPLGRCDASKSFPDLCVKVFHQSLCLISPLLLALLFFIYEVHISTYPLFLHPYICISNVHFSSARSNKYIWSKTFKEFLEVLPLFVCYFELICQQRRNLLFAEFLSALNVLFPIALRAHLYPSHFASSIYHEWPHSSL